MKLTTCVFDAYGTLFDVAAAARATAAEPGREAFAAKWQGVAEAWRQKQLQYTWLRAITGAQGDFWQVTQDGLDWALARHGLDDTELRERLLALYWALDAYPDVPDVLATLKTAGLRTAILSNGSMDMLTGAVASAGIEELLDAVLSVDSVGIFKPAAAVYDLVGQQMGCDAGEVLYVSSNGWDAACATGYGFQTAWVNRAAEPMDNLPWRPAHVLPDLTGVPALAGVAP